MSKDKDPQDTPNQESKPKTKSWVSEARDYRKTMRNHDKEDFAAIESDHEYRMLFVESDLTLNDDELEQAKQYGVDRRQQDETQPHEQETESLTEPETQSEQDDEAPDESEAQSDQEEKHSVIQDTSQKARDIFRQQQQELRQELGDFESFVGETGTKAVGAGIFLVSFLVLINELSKMGYVSPWHRVFLGVLVSGGLLAFAYRQHDRRPSLSNIAALAGFVGLYVINYISYAIYQFYDADIFLIINVLNTTGILAVALRFQKIALFYMAIVGVYYSPVVIRLQIDYLHVMIYLIVSTILIMTIAYRQGWNYINIWLYGFVVVPMLHWLWVKTPAVANFGLTFGIITGVSALFFGMVLFFGLQKDRKLTSTEYFMYFFTILLYIGCGIKVMYYDAGMPLEDVGLFVFVMGLVLAGVSMAMYLNRPFDTILFDNTQIISLIFITFSVPSFTQPSSWNFLWIAESVILLWIAQITALRIVRNFSGGTVVLAILMLVHDWFVTYTGAFQPFFFNDAVKSAVYTVLALGISVYLMVRNENKYQKNDTILFLTYEVYRGILSGFAIFVLWIIGNIELNYHNFTDKDHAILLNGIYNSIFFGLLWVVSKRYELDAKKFVEGVLLVLIVSYFFVDRFSVLPLRDAYLVDGASGWDFLTHYLSLGLIIAISALIMNDLWKNRPKLFLKSLWLFAPLAVVYLSFEFEHCLVILSYAPGDNISHLLDNIWHIGWEILWAVCAVAMIGLGIRYQLKPLRMVALLLFAVILFKFFAYDFWLLNTMQKLASTIVLGLLLMGVGNQYNRFLVIINEGKLPAFVEEDEDESHRASEEK